MKSPTIQVFNQENTDTAPRKLGGSTIKKKPFCDRVVNSVSQINPKPQDIEVIKDDLSEYDSYSYKDTKEYFDVFFKCLTPKDTMKILHSYCGGFKPKTPPPIRQSKPVLDEFIQIPQPRFLDKDFQMKLLEQDSDIPVPQSLDDSGLEIRFLKEDFDIPVPKLDDSGLDASYLENFLS